MTRPSLAPWRRRNRFAAPIEQAAVDNAEEDATIQPLLPKMGRPPVLRAREVLQPDYERFVSTTAALTLRGRRRRPQRARQTQALPRHRRVDGGARGGVGRRVAAARRDDRLIRHGAERAAYEGGGGVAYRSHGRSATRLLMNPAVGDARARGRRRGAAVLRARRDLELDDKAWARLPLADRPSGRRVPLKTLSE